MANSKEQVKEVHKHYFSVEVACEVGVNAALLLEYFSYWIAYNEKNRAKETYKDGRYWTFGSVAKILEKLPYLTDKKFRDARDLLLERGLIQTGNYNKKAYDKTLWYTVTKQGYALLQGSNPYTVKIKRKDKNIDRIF